MHCKNVVKLKQCPLVSIIIQRLFFLFQVSSGWFLNMVINLRVKTLDSQDHEFTVEDDVRTFWVFSFIIEICIIKRNQYCVVEIDYSATVQRTHSFENWRWGRPAKAYLLWTSDERWSSTNRLQWVHRKKFEPFYLTESLLNCPNVFIIR